MYKKNMKKALITGISGQDGAYLAEYLLNLNYEVHGIVRRHSVAENQSYRLEKIFDKIHLHYGDVTDFTSIIENIQKYHPDEIYNLAAQSHVRISFEIPNYTFQSNTQGFLNILEAARLTNQKIKIYQASSSEMFGNNIDEDGFQRITTKMTPVSPYGCSKLAAHNLANNYRNSYNMFIVSGILFNHESKRRGTNFVTAKVCEGAVKILKGKSKTLSLGNLNAARDWGHSKDYVKAMHLMMQNNIAKDYVVATGESHTIENLVNYVFNKLNLDAKKYIQLDPSYLRPEELNILKGDSAPIRNELNWEPEYTFETLIDEMLEYYLTLK
jgi:GDPmannose 4,6-dehydratase